MENGSATPYWVGQQQWLWLLESIKGASQGVHGLRTGNLLSSGSLTLRFQFSHSSNHRAVLALGPIHPSARRLVVLHRRCTNADHLVDQTLVVEQQQASLHTMTVHHTPELHPQSAHRGEGGKQHLSQVLCSQLLCVWLCQGCVASLLLCGHMVPPEAQQQLQIIFEAGLVGHENIGNQQLVDDANEPPAEAELRGQLIGSACSQYMFDASTWQVMQVLETTRTRSSSASALLYTISQQTACMLFRQVLQMPLWDHAEHPLSFSLADALAPTVLVLKQQGLFKPHGLKQQQAFCFCTWASSA